MEIFSMFIPLWGIITTYVIGMFVIGYPMGLYSLKVWKHNPHGSSFAEQILFPFIYYNMTNPKDISKAGLLADMLQTSSALEKDDRTALMQYVFWTMLLWPIRFMYLSVIHTAVVIVRILYFCGKDILSPILSGVGLLLKIFSLGGARVLLACKKCSSI